MQFKHKMHNLIKTNKIGNARTNVTLRRVHVTTVVVEKQ